MSGAVGVSIRVEDSGRWSAAVSIGGAVRYEYHFAVTRRDAWVKVREWLDLEMTGRCLAPTVVEFAKP